jgi:hypothetical protein
MKTVACTLGALGLLTGVAWADPVGSADVRQILNMGTFLGPTVASTTQQRTFLTTDPIVAGATYYDSNGACAGVQPTKLQFFAFNLEGQLVLGRDRDTTTGVNSGPPAPGSKYQLLRADLDAGALPAGAYNVVFRVWDCTSTDIPAFILVSGFYSIRVLAP